MGRRRARSATGPRRLEPRAAERGRRHRRRVRLARERRRAARGIRPAVRHRSCRPGRDEDPQRLILVGIDPSRPWRSDASTEPGGRGRDPPALVRAARAGPARAMSGVDRAPSRSVPGSTDGCLPATGHPLLHPLAERLAQLVGEEPGQEEVLAVARHRVADVGRRGPPAGRRAHDRAIERVECRRPGHGGQESADAAQRTRSAAARRASSRSISSGLRRSDRERGRRATGGESRSRRSADGSASQSERATGRPGHARPVAVGGQAPTAGPCPSDGARTGPPVGPGAGVVPCTQRRVGQPVVGDVDPLRRPRARPAPATSG